jgi:hypothetical protein
MLEYFDPDSGNSVYLHGIYDKGKAGQIVVLGEKFASESSVFAGYKVPAMFTIDRAITGQSYVLKDDNGREIIVPRDLGSYLYPIAQWFKWHRGERAVKDAASSKKIETLEGKVDLMKEILSPHVRVITEKEAEKLGVGSKS